MSKVPARKIAANPDLFVGAIITLPPAFGEKRATQIREVLVDNDAVLVFVNGLEDPLQMSAQDEESCLDLISY